jgi:hypothetical protein
MTENDDLVLPEFDDLPGAEESNPIPPDAIGLADAYYAVLCAVTPNWSDLYDEVDRIESDLAKHVLEKGTDPDLSHFDWALHGTERVQRQFLRRSLVAQELTAHVQNPETKELVPLRAAGWEAVDPSLLGGILDDYGGTIENPAHPDATIADVKCPVFTAKKFRRPVGRPPGSGSWRLADEPLLMEMQQLIHTGKATSPFSAAGQVVGKAAGGSTDESKIRRLVRRYKSRVGN